MRTGWQAGKCDHLRRAHRVGRRVGPGEAGGADSATSVQHHGITGTEHRVGTRIGNDGAQRGHAGVRRCAASSRIRHDHGVRAGEQGRDILIVRREAARAAPGDQVAGLAAGDRDRDRSVVRGGTTGIDHRIDGDQQFRRFGDDEGERGVASHRIGDRHTPRAGAQVAGGGRTVPIGRDRCPRVGQAADATAGVQHDLSVACTEAAHVRHVLVGYDGCIGQHGEEERTVAAEGVGQRDAPRTAAKAAHLHGVGGVNGAARIGPGDGDRAAAARRHDRCRPIAGAQTGLTGEDQARVERHALPDGERHIVHAAVGVHHMQQVVATAQPTEAVDA